jgi:hypothetical protein
MYCDCSGCEYKKGGNTALPYKTSAAVVGLINAPALTKNAKRPLLKMLFKVPIGLPWFITLDL